MLSAYKLSNSNFPSAFVTAVLLSSSDSSVASFVSLEWLDKNIDYFDGTVSFISKDFVDDDEVSFTVVPYAGYVLDKVSCNYDDYEVSPITNESNTKYLFKYRNNGHDSKCSISFKHN